MQIQSEPLMASATNNNQEEEEEEGASSICEGEGSSTREQKETQFCRRPEKVVQLLQVAIV